MDRQVDRYVNIYIDEIMTERQIYSQKINGKEAHKKKERWKD